MICFGHEFPEGTTMANVHLFCYRYWKPNTNHFMERHEHFTRAIQALWPENLSNGQKGFIWSDWAHRRVKGWCDEDYQILWGPSSAGKSTDIGMCILADWLSAPECTTSNVCSTSKEMLEKRIWREILKFHSMYRGDLPGEAFKTPMRIVYKDANDAGGQNTINGIFGVAVWKGSEEDAVSNLSGMHNERNRLAIDEAQATRPAAISCWDNLSTGKDAKFVAMGNPNSRLDPMGRISEPENGWDSVDVSTGEWRTKFGGIVYHYDGLDSPAIAEPEKYWFLLNQAQIDSQAKRTGRDSPSFWTQRRGFVPSEGLTETVLTESFIERFNIKEAAVWKESFVTKVGFDPSFSSGGDNCMLAPAKIGEMTNGMKGVEFLDPIKILMNVTDGTPGGLTYHISNEVIKNLETLGLTPSDLAIDCTGSQRTIADVIETEWANKHPKDPFHTIHRIGFGGKASDLPVSAEDPTESHEVYQNKVTELYYSFREFGRNDQIRGLQSDAIEEFCGRECNPKADARNRILLETKREMKKRTGGKSPDIADSEVCVIDYARSVMGIFPGVGLTGVNKGITEAEMRKHDIEGSQNLYMDDSFGEDNYMDQDFI